MALDEKSDDGDPLKFLIKSNDPARDETRIVCQVSYPVSGIKTFFSFIKNLTVTVRVFKLSEST